MNKAETVGGIIDEIKRVFDGNDKGEIMLSTVHKSKGLEAKRVYILATERMPHLKVGMRKTTSAMLLLQGRKKPCSL